MTTCCGPLTKLLALAATILVAVSLGLLMRGDEEPATGDEPASAVLLASVGQSNTATANTPDSAEPAEAVTKTDSVETLPASGTEPVEADSVPATNISSEDERMTAEVVGKWKTVRDAGPREIVIRDDGTATMDVEINTFALRLLFGKQMQLQIKWHIADGLLHMTTVGGEPEDKVDLLKKTYGESLAYPILELTEQRLLVKDGEGDPDHDWERVTD